MGSRHGQLRCVGGKEAAGLDAPCRPGDGPPNAPGESEAAHRASERQDRTPANQPLQYARYCPRPSRGLARAPQEANADQMNKTEDVEIEREYIPLLRALLVLGVAVVGSLLGSGMTHPLLHTHACTPTPPASRCSCSGPALHGCEQRSSSAVQCSVSRVQCEPGSGGRRAPGCQAGCAEAAAMPMERRPPAR